MSDGRECELYPHPDDSLVVAKADEEVPARSRTDDLLWRLVAYLATEQLADLEAERAELNAILTRAATELGETARIGRVREHTHGR